MASKTDTIPLLNVKDDLWIVFRDFIPASQHLASVSITSLTSEATVEVAEATIYDPTLLGAATTVTFDQQGITKVVEIPSNILNRATRVKVVSGRVSVEAHGPFPFVTFIAAPPVTTFGV